MSKGVHNIVFYVSPDPECSRTTQNSEISLAPSRGCILYAIYGNSTCVINHIVVTAIDKKYRNYYVSTTSDPVLPSSLRLGLTLASPLILGDWLRMHPDAFTVWTTGLHVTCGLCVTKCFVSPAGWQSR